MKVYRLSQVARKLNIDKGQIIETLEEKGFKAPNGPNGKITDEQLDILTENLATEIVDSYPRKRTFVINPYVAFLSQEESMFSGDIGAFYEACSRSIFGEISGSYYQSKTQNESPLGFKKFKKSFKNYLRRDYKNHVIHLPSFDEYLIKRSPNKGIAFNHSSACITDLFIHRNQSELDYIHQTGKDSFSQFAEKIVNGIVGPLEYEELIEETTVNLNREKAAASINNLKRYLKRLVCGLKIKRTFYDLKSLIFTIIPPKLFYVFTDEDDKERDAYPILSLSTHHFHYAREACLHLFLNIAFSENEQHKHLNYQYK